MSKEAFLINPKELGGHERMSIEYASERNAVVFYHSFPFLLYLLKYADVRGVVCIGTIYQRIAFLIVFFLFFSRSRRYIYLPFFRKGARFHYFKTIWLRFIASGFSIITISTYERDNLREYTESSSIFVRENTSDYDVISDESGLAGGASVRLQLSVIGRLDNVQKNVDPFLKYCEGLQDFVDINLIGTCSNINYPSVNSVGFVDNPWDYCKGVLVIPSIYEGVPLVLLEAYRRGIPVICNSIPELQYLVKSDYCVDFSDKASQVDFLKALKQLTSRNLSSNDCFTSATINYGSLDESAIAFEDDM
jgi:glycosyltransferase involved in cell wall biosynthesis